MKILLTGANGFLGRHFLDEAKSHQVETLYRSNSATYNIDIQKEFQQSFPSFDLVVHAAGKAHSVPKTESESKVFFDVNENGTVHLLNALNDNPPKRFVLISTVAVYGRDSGKAIDEEHPLDGKTPYALSKINAERELTSWCKEREVPYQILRLPLICGHKPPGNLESMIKGIQKGYYLRIGKGEARKSMVSAKDVARFILYSEGVSGIYNLTDGIHPTMAETDNRISALLHKKVKVAPLSFIKVLALVGDIISAFPINSSKLNKLTSSLTFSDVKARKELGWNPNPALKALTIDHE